MAGGGRLCSLRHPRCAVFNQGRGEPYPELTRFWNHLTFCKALIYWRSPRDSNPCNSLERLGPVWFWRPSAAWMTRSLLRHLDELDVFPQHGVD